jgi:hypothetical protein
MFYVPLNILGMIILPLSPWQRRFQVGFFAVFVMANYVIFQPWELDNTKVDSLFVFSNCVLRACVVRCVARN